MMCPCRVWLSLWLTVLMMATGCPQADQTGTQEVGSSPHAGTAVRFLVPTGFDLVEIWTPALNDWADESGGVADIVEFDFASTDELTLAERISAEQTSLVLLPAPSVNPLVANNLVAPIPRQVLDEGLVAWNSISPPVRHTLGSLGGVPAMVPVTCPLPICCYRADLLEEAGMQIPTTWEEYDTLASTLSEWAPGLVAVEPWGHPFRVTTFLSRAISAAKHPAQYSVEFDVMSGRPLIASAPFVLALDEAVSLKPYLAEAVASFSPGECLRELREGRAAMGIIWETTPDGTAQAGGNSAATQVSSSGSETSVPLTFAPLPGRSEVYNRETKKWESPPVEDQNRPALCSLGGFVVCVLSTATDREQAAAWDLWGLLESYQIDGTIIPLPGLPVLPSSRGTPYGWDELSAIQSQQARQAMSISLQITPLICELPIFGQRRFRSDLSGALGRVWMGEQTSSEALEAVAEQWSSAVEELGHSKVLNGYRARLGLTRLPE